MNEDTEARQESRGRNINVMVHGDTADEIELAALDAAREFFGRDVRLEVVKDYTVITVRSVHGIDTDKKYTAAGGVKVRTVE